MARTASKTAAPAAQTATEFPKITDKEMTLLKGVATSEYQDGRSDEDMAGKMVWSWSATRDLENKRGAGGLVASLVKKGLLKHSPRNGDEDECIAFTLLGAQAYLAAQPAPVAAQPAKVAVEQVSEPVEAQAEPVQTEAPEVDLAVDEAFAGTVPADKAEAVAQQIADANSNPVTITDPATDTVIKTVQPTPAVHLPAPAPVEVPAAVEAFKPKRMNPAREDLLIAMAEAPDAGAKLWDEQPKARDKTKAILLDGAFVKHDGKAAQITPKGRAFATYAALHRTAEGKPAQAPKAEAPARKPGRPAKAAQVTQAVKTAPVQAAPTGQDGSKLAAIVQGIYGVDAIQAPTIALIWAASQMVEVEGKEAAKAELSALNRRREAAGKAPAFPPYGSILF